MAGKKKAELQPLKIVETIIKVRGLSPLIMHRWDEKAKQEMLDKQMKKTVKKEPKDPERQYQSSIYWISEGQLGFPADAFKKAAVRGAKQLGLVMTDMKGAFFVKGIYSEKEGRQMVPIKGSVTKREDMVRLESGVADIRFRAHVEEWEAELNIKYNETMVSEDQLINMFNAGGFAAGVGEWRPEKNGDFGQFEVVV